MKHILNFNGLIIGRSENQRAFAINFLRPKVLIDSFLLLVIKEINTYIIYVRVTTIGRKGTKYTPT